MEIYNAWTFQNYSLTRQTILKLLINGFEINKALKEKKWSGSSYEFQEKCSTEGNEKPF